MLTISSIAGSMTSIKGHIWSGPVSFCHLSPQIFHPHLTAHFQGREPEAYEIPSWSKMVYFDLRTISLYTSHITSGVEKEVELSKNIKKRNSQVIFFLLRSQVIVVAYIWYWTLKINIVIEFKFTGLLAATPPSTKLKFLMAFLHVNFKIVWLKKLWRCTCSNINI